MHYHTPTSLRLDCLCRVSTDWTTQDGAGGGATGRLTSTAERCQCVHHGLRVLCGGHAASHQQGRQKDSGWVVWSKNGRRKTLRVLGWTDWTDQQGETCQNSCMQSCTGHCKHDHLTLGPIRALAKRYAAACASVAGPADITRVAGLQKGARQHCVTQAGQEQSMTPLADSSGRQLGK